MTPSSDNLSALIYFYICSPQQHARNRRAYFTHKFGFDAMKAFILMAGKPDTNPSNPMATAPVRMRSYFAAPETVERLVGGIWYQTYGTIAVSGARQIFEELEAEAAAGFMPSQIYQEVPDSFLEAFRPSWKDMDQSSVLVDTAIVGEKNQENIPYSRNSAGDATEATQLQPETWRLYVMFADNEQQARECIAQQDRRWIFSVEKHGTLFNNFIVNCHGKYRQSVLHRAQQQCLDVTNVNGKHPRVEWYREPKGASLPPNGAGKVANTVGPAENNTPTAYSSTKPCPVPPKESSTDVDIFPPGYAACRDTECFSVTALILPSSVLDTAELCRQIRGNEKAIFMLTSHKAYLTELGNEFHKRRTPKQALIRLSQQITSHEEALSKLKELLRVARRQRFQ